MRRTRGRATGDHAQNQGGLTWRSHTRPYRGLSAYSGKGFLESRMTPQGSSPVRRGAVGKGPVGATRWRPTLRRRCYARPGSTGKPCTGQRGTGDQTNPTGEAREMRSAETVLGVIRERGRHAMFRSRSLESCLRSKDSRAVWRGAVGKGLQGTSLAAYPTASTVLETSREG
jgi:hypothetical protein